jgi:hypothetical protein
MTLSAEEALLDGVASDEEPGTYGLGFFVSVVDERRNGHPHRHHWLFRLEKTTAVFIGLSEQWY